MKTVDELAREAIRSKFDLVNVPLGTDFESSFREYISMFKAGYTARDEEINMLRKQVLDMQERYAGATKYISELEKCLAVAESALELLASIQVQYFMEAGMYDPAIGRYKSKEVSNVVSSPAKEALAQIKAIKEGDTKEVLSSTKISSCEWEE